MRAHAAEIADRKALLAIRAELDRARVTLALQEVKAAIAPPNVARAAAARPFVAMLIKLLAPVIGMSRFGRWLRIASWAMAAWRVALNWRAPAR